jgi:iron complex outermembrane receptor protein
VRGCFVVITRKLPHIGWAEVLAAACVAVAGGAHAQDQQRQAPSSTRLPEVTVYGQGANAAQAQYNTQNADIGALGSQPILNTPTSVTVVPEQLIVNTQAETVNDTLRYLPSVEIRDQQGLEVSRPQSRGFQGTIVQNTRLDGLNTIGTTAIPSENLSGIEVLNGLAGSLYGPETPAGVFNYILKRPTDAPILHYIESFDSNSIFTEQLDAGGRVGPDDKIGYRLDVVHGQGEGYVSGSNANRTLFSGALDYHFDDRTVVELNYSHYQTDITGLPGSVVYDSGKSTLLPKAVDPTTVGLGQPGAGTDLITSTGLIKIKHDFGDGWTLELGGLYQDAVRNLFGITNTFTDNLGDFTTTKNFNAVPHFTIGSNTAQLNGHFDLFGTKNDLTIGTNGFINGQYSYRNSIATVLGSASLKNPVIFPTKPIPNNGGQYRSGSLFEQSAVVADTIHFNDQLALQGVLNTSFISAKSYAASGKVTSADARNGVLSPTVSLIYKPISKLTAYATYSNSVEQGEAAPTGTANANTYQAPYHDTQYEVGAKYAVSDHFLVTLAGFRMTRPLADTSAITNIFAVVGTQRNDGVELFAQGDMSPEISVLGGVTYIDARLLDTGVAATNDKLVVGVPRVKGDIAVDYHPRFADGFALTGAVHFESERAATNTNNTFAPSYATLDVGARYSTRFFKHFATFRFQVINVTDTYYYSSVADGNIVGSPGANTAYFGAPRTFLASLEFDY